MEAKPEMPGDVLRNLLAFIGVTQGAVAARWGLTRQTMNNYVAKGGPEWLWDALLTVAIEQGKLTDIFMIFGKACAAKSTANAG